MKPATAKTIENRKATSPLCMLWALQVSLISRAINIAAGSARPRVYGSSGTAAQMPSFDHPRKFHANGTKTVACLKHLPAQICCRVGWVSRGVLGVRHGAACLLERLPQAVPRLMSDCSVSRHLRAREDQLPSAQQEDWAPHQV